MFEEGDRVFLYPDEMENLSSVGWDVSVQEFPGGKNIYSTIVITLGGNTIFLDMSQFGKVDYEDVACVDNIIKQLMSFRTAYNKALKILEGTD